MSVIITKKLIDEALVASPKQGKHALDPLATFAKENRLPLNILENSHVVNDAEVHMTEGDLWGCISGEVMFIYGGALVEPWKKKNGNDTEDQNELRAKEIRGGETTVLHSGDWLWIPPGEPHQHMTKEGTARLFIVKIPKA